MKPNRVMLLARPTTKVPSYWPTKADKPAWVTVDGTNGYAGWTLGRFPRLAMSAKRVEAVKAAWEEEFAEPGRTWEFKVVKIPLDTR